MKEIKTTNQLLRDLTLARKRGKDLSKIEKVIDVLAQVPNSPRSIGCIAFRVT